MKQYPTETRIPNKKTKEAMKELEDGRGKSFNTVNELIKELQGEDKMEHFDIVREDSCIWLTDKRGENPIQIHLVPSQAKELGEILIEIAKQN